MYNIEQIQHFIADKLGAEIIKVTTDCDLHEDLGCSGDDYDDLMQAYSRLFNVNMDRYIWYFHTDEEGQNFGGMFFRPPNERVDHIPVTPRMLLDFANKGYWDLAYPEHTLPKHRYDHFINLSLLVLFIAYLIYVCM